MNRLKRFGSNLRTSFWFVPTLIVALSVVLAVALIEVDYSGSQQWMARWPRLIESPHDRARFESRLAHVREALDTEPVLAQSTKAWR